MTSVRARLLSLVIAATVIVAGDPARAQSPDVLGEQRGDTGTTPTFPVKDSIAAPRPGDPIVAAPTHCSYAVVKGQRWQVFCGTVRDYRGRYKGMLRHAAAAWEKNRRGEVREAVALYERAVADALDVDQRLSTAAIAPLLDLGAVLVDRGAYRSAEDVWTTLAPLLEVSSDRFRGKLPDFVVELSFTHQSLGAFARARSSWPLPMTHAPGAISRHSARAAFVHAIHQGWWHLERGEYPASERIWRGALRMVGTLSSPETRARARAIAHNALGMLHWNQGQVAQAEGLWREALEAVERAGQRDTAAIIAPLGGLFEIALHQKQVDVAESHLSRALRSAPRQTDTAIALIEIAHRRLARGEYDRAESLYREALVMSSAGFGDPSLVAEGLHNLGIVHAYAGEHDEAITYLEQGLDRLEKQLRPDRSRIAMVRMNLAWASAGSAERRDAGRALEHWSRANAILAEAATEAAETRMDRLAALSNISDSVSLHLTLMADEPAASAQALRSVLHHKGRALDALANRYRATRRRTQHKLFARLRSLRSQLATRAFAASATDGESPDQRSREISAGLRRQIAELEHRLETELAERHEEIQPSLEDIHEALPVGAVAVEYVVYHPFAFGDRDAAPRQRSGEPRYAAYVADWRGQVRGVDLGPVADIDRLALGFRDALSRPASSPSPSRRGAAASLAKVGHLGRALDERVLRPVRQLAGHATTYYIATDGFLAAVPLHALVDERGRYLIESLSLVYIDSIRELLRPPISPPSRGVVILADPAFDQAPRPRTGGEHHAGDARPASRPSSRPIEFPPLRDAEIEARAIATMFSRGDPRLLLGRDATERALESLESPRVLHIATHGFFLGRAVGERGRVGLSSASRRAVRIVRDALGESAENPLLSSGLALTGANLTPDSPRGDDGILTALEATSLRLAGTRLVVLSACDTGLGQTTVGDGVHGLRRALRIAGAETVVMSLWKVSDAATKDLMVSYYRHLLAGRGRSEALRAAQRDLLGDPERAHPFYWAAFIASGDPRSLDAPDRGGPTYITGKPWRKAIPENPYRRTARMLEFTWGPGGHVPVRSASSDGLVPASHSASAGVVLRTHRDLVLGAAVDFTTARDRITRAGLVVRLGRDLTIDEVPWLHPEATAELGVSWIRNLGMSDRNIDIGQRENAILPHAGLRVGVLVDLTSRLGLGLWLQGRQSLGSTTRTVYARPECERPGCSAERWTVGGRTIGLHLALRQVLSW